MAFFKKNIVLANNKTIGYLTIIRISNSLGIKVILNDKPKERNFVGVFADKVHFINEVNDVKTEFENLYIEIKNEDDLGVCLFDDRGMIIAYGGKSSLVNKNEITKYLEESKKSWRSSFVEQQNVISNEKEETIETVNKVKEYKTNILQDKNNFKEYKKDETVEEMLNRGKSKNFYYSIKEKLDELLIIHPPESSLEEMIPESKWVMVHYTKTDYYVVGVLKTNDVVTHIAYGLKGIDNIPPPKEAKEICDFITTERKNDKNYGYYLFFQSAENGEIIKGL